MKRVLFVCTGNIFFLDIYQLDMVIRVDKRVALPVSP